MPNHTGSVLDGVTSLADRLHDLRSRAARTERRLAHLSTTDIRASIVYAKIRELSFLDSISPTREEEH